MIERNGPLSYLIQVSGGRVWKRHIDHIREMHDSPLQEVDGTPVLPDYPVDVYLPATEETPEHNHEPIASSATLSPLDEVSVTPLEPEAEIVPSEAADTPVVTTPTPTTTTTPPTPQETATPLKRYPLQDRQKHRCFKT